MGLDASLASGLERLRYRGLSLALKTLRCFSKIRGLQLIQSITMENTRSRLSEVLYQERASRQALSALQAQRSMGSRSRVDPDRHHCHYQMRQAIKRLRQTIWEKRLILKGQGLHQVKLERLNSFIKYEAPNPNPNPNPNWRLN